MKNNIKYGVVSILVPVIKYKKLYTAPKIFIPHKLNSKGKKIASVDAGDYWYVYYYYRNPDTKKLEKQPPIKQGINLLRTVAERREACEVIRNAILRELQTGFSPYVKFKPNHDEITEVYTIIDSFELAYKLRCNEWKESTIDSAKAHFGVFKSWLDKKVLDNLPMELFERKHVVLFLDYLVSTRKVNKTTRNNYKRTISSLLTKLVELEIIKYNPSANVKILKSAPKKNKAFSNEQLRDITIWLKDNDPYLHQYLKFVTYAFMRLSEVNRMKIKNIDRSSSLIIVDTKTDANIIPIIDTLSIEIDKMCLDKFSPNDFVFTKFEKPSEWKTDKEKSKVQFFGRRFVKLKKHFNLDDDFGMYSFRHNAALNLYHSFVASGMSENDAVNKLQKIMRHKNPQTTRLYLRDIGAFAVADYSKDYTFEF